VAREHDRAQEKERSYSTRGKRGKRATPERVKGSEEGERGRSKEGTQQNRPCKLSVGELPEKV